MNYDSKEGEDEMSEIYTGIDLGSDCIKVVVASKEKKSFHVLAASSHPSSGISHGQITNTRDASNCLKKCIRKAEDMLGLSLKKAVVCVPTENAHITIVSGKVDTDLESFIDGEDITRVMKDALLGQIDHERELVTAIPIHFSVDDQITRDPKGLKGSSLSMKAVVTTVPKEPLYRILEVVRLAGIETLDVAFHTTGDYFEVRSDQLDLQVGAIVNIGKEQVDVSIFNKGIMIKDKVIPVGSHFIDKDISYVYHISESDARQLKEEAATAVFRYADQNDVYELTISENEKKEISQTELSKVVESRVVEILKLVKKELKILTNREIRYIIITGGLSELAGFPYVVEDVLGRNARVCNIKTMGVRHNKYSSVLGLLKYYDDKLSLRGKRDSMFSEDEVSLLYKDKKEEITNEHIVNKVFGHFFEN